ncbi:MAG TPA: dienelactone hydrolase family protein [Acetobacteraceae bacterium]|nr:dienelactone hydrolase family protein [Acetobacteraceae bacterium]
MRRPSILLCLLAAFAINVGQAAAAGEADVAIPPQPVRGSRMPSASLPAMYWVPDGQGPFPAMILLHGCGGPYTTAPAWVGRLLGWGYAVIAPSSFLPRGVYGGVCEPYRQPLVTARDRAGDVISTALWLRTRREIDGSRIGVIGFSHGGSTAAWVTQREYEQEFPHLLRAAIDYYGPCRQPATKGTVPLLALAGEADTWGFSARACRTFGSGLRPDQVFEVYTYPGAVHDFDNPNAAPGTKLGHPHGYDAAAAEESFARVKTFLDRYMAPAAQ